MRVLQGLLAAIAAAGTGQPVSSRSLAVSRPPPRITGTADPASPSRRMAGQANSSSTGASPGRSALAIRSWRRPSPGLHPRLRSEVGAGLLPPQQDDRREPDQPDDQVNQYAHPGLEPAHRQQDQQRVETEQHGARDSGPVPASVAGPGQPEPEPDRQQPHDNGDDDIDGDQGTDLVRGVFGVGLLERGPGGADREKADHERDRADNGSGVHELDRGQHRGRGRGRLQWPRRLPGRRVWLVHNCSLRLSVTSMTPRPAGVYPDSLRTVADLGGYRRDSGAGYRQGRAHVT